MTNPLGEKEPLGSSVSLSEWVQHIDRIVKIRNRLDEFLMRKAFIGNGN